MHIIIKELTAALSTSMLEMAMCLDPLATLIPKKPTDKPNDFSCKD